MNKKYVLKKIQEGVDETEILVTLQDEKSLKNNPHNHLGSTLSSHMQGLDPEKIQKEMNKMLCAMSFSETGTPTIRFSYQEFKDMNLHVGDVITMSLEKEGEPV